MNKNIKCAIPKWRFLEFKGNGDWERKKLGKMAFIVNDKIAIEKLNAETYISTENMLPNFAGVSTASQLPQTGNFTKFKAGDILVSNIRPYLKKVWRSNKTGGASNDVIVFRSKSDVDSNFLEFILKNELFINYVMKNAKGLKMPRGDKGSMLIYPVYIPPYPTFSEQQKIADCLSSIDDLISAEEKKLALLNDYKKGWMQKLFPAEGKTVPEWRFPEFKDRGEWEEKKIGTFGEIINGLSGKKSTYFGNGEPYIQYKQVFDKSYIDFSECGKVSIKNDEKQNAVQKGDILFTTSSETPDEVGFASVVVNKPHKKTYLNSFCFILRPFDLENTIPTFFSFLFQSSIYRRSVYAIAQGSTRYNLSKVAFRKLKIPIPPKPEEQQKIADFLSGIDDLIIRQTDKIEALKQHKKALMQGLFPAVEEVLK